LSRGLWLTALPGILLVACLQGATAEDVGRVATAREDLHSYQAITAFHNLFLDEPPLEVRLLESDASAAVAMDPITLFLVITNNGTADYAGHTWELPFRVSRFGELAHDEHAVVIEAEVDVQDGEGSVTGTVPKRWRIHYDYRGGEDLDPEIWIQEIVK
jgi:hypothetical protein